MTYDVIIVGARVGGAATAMLLARQGLRVLVVDRARFPSDTLSTHQVQAPGIDRLRRWGLLDGLGDAPPTRDVRLDAGPAVLHGSYPGDLHSPRRTVLDAMLVDAARAAGAEAREGFAVEALLRDGDRVTGVRGRSRGGAPAVEERAALVVGGDGKRSFVADAVGAARYRVRPPRTFAAYSYFAGVPLPVGEIYLRPGRMVPAFATNGGLAMICVIGPLGDLDAYRADPDGYFLATLDGCGDLGERVRAGERAERYRAAPDVTNEFRVPHGPGWALVGDAGVVMDPVGAQGISSAFRDADGLAAAVATGDFAGYHRDRDAAIGALYDLVGDVARLRLGTRERLLFRSLAGRRAEVDRFLAVLSGTEPAGPYLRPSAVLRRLVVSTTRGRSEEAGWTRSTSPAGSSGSPPSTTSCSFR